MKRNLLKSIAGAMLAIILVSALMQTPVSAQESHDLPDEQQSAESPKTSQNAKKLEGVWEAQVTLRACQTGFPVGTLRGMTSFIRGGALLGTNANPNPPVSFGRWQYLGGRNYSSVERFFRYNPDGTFAGVQRIARNFTLNRDGDHFTGVVNVEIFDSNDNLILTACATEITKRVE